MSKPLINVGDYVRPKKGVKRSNYQDITDISRAKVLRRIPGNYYYNESPKIIIEHLHKNHNNQSRKTLEVYARSFEIAPALIDSYDLV